MNDSAHGAKKNHTAAMLCGVAAAAIAMAAVTFVAPQPAQAQEESNLDKARARYKEARAAYQAEDYPTAVARFEEAFALKPNAKLLFLIFKAYDKQGKSGKALRYLVRYAESSPEAREEVGDRLGLYKKGLLKKARKHAIGGVYGALDIAVPGRRTTTTATAVEVEESGPLFDDVPVGITTEPPGARVYVDDKEWGVAGTTPLTLRMFTGKHKVWVELDFHTEQEAELFVRPVTDDGKPQTLKFAFEREQVPVEIKTNPPSAKIIYIKNNGERLTLGKGRFAGNLPAGDAKFIIQALGSDPRTFEESIVKARVDESGSMLLNFDMRGDAAQARDELTKTGDLVVSGYLIGADVYVDGKFVGQTPGPLRTSLSTGSHSVELRKEGFVTHRELVTINKDTTTTVTTPDELAVAESSVNLGGVLLTVAGVAAAGGGGFFLWQGMQKGDDADAAESAGAADAQDLRDEADQANLFSYGLFGVGGAALLGGIAMFAFTGDSGQSSLPAHDDVKMALTPLPGGGGVLIEVALP